MTYHLEPHSRCFRRRGEARQRIWQSGHERILTVHRGTEMDEGQSTTQPPWFLDGPYHKGRVHACILFVIIPAAADTASYEACSRHVKIVSSIQICKDSRMRHHKLSAMHALQALYHSNLQFAVKRTTTAYSSTRVCIGLGTSSV